MKKAALLLCCIFAVSLLFMGAAKAFVYPVDWLKVWGYK